MKTVVKQKGTACLWALLQVADSEQTTHKMGLSLFLSSSAVKGYSARFFNEIFKF